MRRFFVSSGFIKKTEFASNDKDLVNRFRSVLRLKAGDRVFLFDEKGDEYEVELNLVSHKEVSGKIIRKLENRKTMKPEIYIYQALTKPLSKFETVLQKGTELGVSGFFPMITKRTEAKGKIKIERWEKIIQEAAEQCGRRDMPSLSSVIELDQIEKLEGLTILPYEEEKSIQFKEFLPNIKKVEKVNILIGPEGGFDASEVEKLQKAGAKVCSLGKNILRTETVCPAMLGAIFLS